MSDGNTYWFVSYAFKNPDKTSGFGSINITLGDDLFLPKLVRNFITDRIGGEVVILNWKKIEKSQMEDEEED